MPELNYRDVTAAVKAARKRTRNQKLYTEYRNGKRKIYSLATGQAVWLSDWLTIPETIAALGAL